MKHILIVSGVVVLVVAVLVLFFAENGKENGQKEDDRGVVQESQFNKALGAESNIVLRNQGGSMEGHTPRGFEGMGTGLFVGDNLNPNFPDGDGVQLFISFDMGVIAKKDVTSAILRSEHAHSSGSPFNLGVLNVEEIRYDSFSSTLWNLRPEEGFACIFSEILDDLYECDVTEVVKRSIKDGYGYAQFRLLFDEAGNKDGEQDLLMFYITDSNTNEPGIFELVIR